MMMLFSLHSSEASSLLSRQIPALLPPRSECDLTSCTLPERPLRALVELQGATFSSEFSSFYRGTDRRSGDPFPVHESTLQVSDFIKFAVGSYVAKVLHDRDGPCQLIRGRCIPLEVLYIYSKLFPEELEQHVSLKVRRCMQARDEFTTVLLERWKELDYPLGVAQEMKLTLDRAIEMTSLLYRTFVRDTLRFPVSSEFIYAMRGLPDREHPGAWVPSENRGKADLLFEIDRLSDLAFEQLRQIDRIHQADGLMEQQTRLDTLYFSTHAWKGVHALALEDMSIVRGSIFYMLCSALPRANSDALALVMESAAYRIEMRELLDELKPLIHRAGLFAVKTGYMVVRALFGL